MRAIKQMVRVGERVTAKEAQMLRLPALVEALQSSDQDEGVLAFKEKRAPNFKRPSASGRKSSGSVSSPARI